MNGIANNPTPWKMKRTHHNDILYKTMMRRRRRRRKSIRETGGSVSSATGETWSWVVAVSVTGVNLIKDVRPPPPAMRHRVPLPVDETS